MSMFAKTWWDVFASPYVLSKLAQDLRRKILEKLNLSLIGEVVCEENLRECSLEFLLRIRHPIDLSCIVAVQRSWFEVRDAPHQVYQYVLDELEEIVTEALDEKFFSAETKKTVKKKAEEGIRFLRTRKEKEKEHGKARQRS